MSFPHPGILIFLLSFFDAYIYDHFFSRAVFNYQVIGLRDNSTLVVLSIKYTFSEFVVSFRLCNALSCVLFYEEYL